MKIVKTLALSAVALCAAHSFAATHTEVAKAPRLPFMRGINFDGYFQWRNDSLPRDANTYSNLVAKGFDHVRLPIDFRHIRQQYQDRHVRRHICPWVGRVG